MPYKISGKGDGLGCSGYAVQDETGKTVGCHATRVQAEDHLAALYANVPEAKKDMSITVDPKYPGAGIKRPMQGKAGDSTTGSNIKSKYGKKPKKTNRGRSPDALGSSGAIGTNGGSSMGAL